MSPSSRPTLRTLAAAAGVTVTTVSLALRNHRKISEATRIRIKRLARKQGYQPDPQIAKLMQHLRMKQSARLKASICALTTNPTPRDDHYLAQIEAGAKRRAAELGYAFDHLHLADDSGQRARLQRVLRTRGVEGVLLLPMEKPADFSELLSWSEFSVVATSYSVLSPRVYQVVPDQFSNLMLACRELIARGYRRIGLVISPGMELRVHHTFTAAIAWHNCYSGAEPVQPLTDSPPRFDKIGHWIRHERPDAIITEYEHALLAAVRREGFQVPRDFAVVTQSRLPESPAAGIDEDPAEVGCTAAELLANMIQRGEKGIPSHPKTTLVEGKWVDGNFVRSIRKKTLLAPSSRARHRVAPARDDGRPS